MKQTQYNVFYLNGKQKIIYAFSFTEAAITGMNYALSMGWNYEITKIIDDKFSEITEIKPPTFKQKY